MNDLERLVTFKKLIDRRYINVNSVGGMSVQKVKYWCPFCSWEVVHELAEKRDSRVACIAHFRERHLDRFHGITKKMRMVEMLNRILDK